MWYISTGHKDSDRVYYTGLSSFFLMADHLGDFTKLPIEFTDEESEQLKAFK